MSILSIQTSAPTGLVGVVPQLIYIETNDTQSGILAPGYLDSARRLGENFNEEQMACVITTDDGPGWYNLSIDSSTGVITLVPEGGGSNDVLLPVAINHIAMYVNTTGTIGDISGVTAIHPGSLQAGISGTAGSLILFPGTALKGSFEITATENSADTLFTLTNSQMGQATVMTIGDPGVASSGFVLLNSAGTQIINTGSLQVALGNIFAGSNGNVGSFLSLPSIANRGALILSATSNSANFTTTITNAVMGQSTIISIPDPLKSTSTFIIADSDDSNTTQYIQTGNFGIRRGFLEVGQAGTQQGEILLFGGGSNTGFFTISGNNNLGAFTFNLTNSPAAQNTTVSIQDPHNAVGRILVAAQAAPFTAGNFPQVAAGAPGAGGLMVDSNFAVANIQPKSNIKTALTGNIGGAGAGPLTVTVAGLVGGSPVVCTVASSSNSCSVLNAIAISGGFNVTVSADPGASLIVNYVATIAAQ